MDKEILNQLSCGQTKTSAELALVLNTSRVDVNASIQNLEKNGLVFRVTNAFPIAWQQNAASPSLTPPTSPPDTLVIIDLGNTHDCLANLMPYCRSSLVEVRAYADLHYTGYTGDENICCFQLIRASSSAKNAADVDMIWDLAVILSDPRMLKKQVIICSKDKGFLSIQDKIVKLGHTFLFATHGWADLRLHLE